MGICCHPYDVCRELIAREMGGHIVKPNGSALDSRLDTTSPVAWAGYANDRVVLPTNSGQWIGLVFLFFDCYR
jgi:hypothetical protein